MNIRLTDDLEQQLNFFANELHTTKSALMKPYVLRLVEDLDDYYRATLALKDNGTISFETLAKELETHVEN